MRHLAKRPASQASLISLRGGSEPTVLEGLWQRNFFSTSLEVHLFGRLYNKSFCGCIHSPSKVPQKRSGLTHMKSHPSPLIQCVSEEIHVSAAQRYAAAACQDGLCETTVRDIASLAAWGRHMQNCERDLHRWMPFAFQSELETHSTSIEVFDPNLGKVVEKEIPLLLASDALNAIYRRRHKTLWDTVVGATAGKCAEFWSQQAWAHDHPVKVCSGMPMAVFIFMFLLKHHFFTCLVLSRTIAPCGAKVGSGKRHHSSAWAARSVGNRAHAENPKTKDPPCFKPKKKSMLHELPSFTLSARGEILYGRCGV